MKCRRCGQCCEQEVCKIGRMAFGISTPPCPGLIKKEGVLCCAFVIAEKEFGMKSKLAIALGIGLGCCNTPIPF